MLGRGLTAAAAAAGVLIADIIARPSGWLASALGRQPLVAIGLTFLVAAASFHWIEQPMLRIKRRFTP